MNFYKKLRDKVYNVVWIFEDKPINDAYDVTIIALVIINLLATTISTMQGLYNDYKFIFELVDLICISAFCFDYVVRIWSCVSNDKFKGIITGRIRYALTPMAIIDFLSIAPSFFPLSGHLKLLRIFRLARILKLSKYCKSFMLIKNALCRKKEMLMSSFVLIFIVLFVLSSIVYYCENPAQPDKFTSIPATLWWGVITLTSVGYSDIYPITLLGKIVTGITALLAIPLVAIPGGIIFSSITEEIKIEEMEENKENKV